MEADPRTPIPFRRPGAAVVVHASGFGGQRELLTFASQMDSSTEFSEVSLTRVTPTEAWFTVRATSPQQVAEALLAFQGFQIQVDVDQNLVEARVAMAQASTSVPSAVTPPPSRPVAADPEPSPATRDELLPPRPRFRVFRQMEDTQGPPAVPVTAPAAAAAPPRPTMPPPPAWAAPARPASPRPASAPSAAPAPATAAPAPIPAPAAPAAQSPVASGPAAAVPRPAAPVRPQMSPPPVAPAPAAQAAPAARQAPPPPAEPPAPVASPSPEAAAPAPAPAPARPAPRVELDHPDEVVMPEERPGGAVLTVEHLTLVAYPFHSFAALNEFQGAIRGLHGVTNTRVRRFYRGTLHLAVDYEDMIPLPERLRDLRGFNYTVASESRTEIELVLEESGSLVAAGEN